MLGDNYNDASEYFCPSPADDVFRLMPHQKMVDVVTQPPAVCRRLLINARTGSGKTIMMCRILDNFYDDRRAKVLIFPNKNVATNFYKEMNSVPNKYQERLKKTVFFDGGETMNIERLADELAMTGKLRGADQTFAAPLRAFSYAEAGGGAAFGKTPNALFLWWKRHGHQQHGAWAPGGRPHGTLYHLDDGEAGSSDDDSLEAGGRRGVPAASLPDVPLDASNPYNNTIVIMDEVHNLTRPNARNKPYRENLAALRTALATAHNCCVYGLTATALEDSLGDFTELLGVVKGQYDAGRSDEGYYMYFNEMPGSTFASVVTGNPMKCLGQVLKVPLLGVNRTRYLKKEKEFSGMLDVDQRMARLLPYCNMSTHYTKTADKAWIKGFLGDPESYATKIAAVHQFLEHHNYDLKTLLLIQKSTGFSIMLSELVQNGKYCHSEKECPDTGFYLSAFLDRGGAMSDQALLDEVNADVEGVRMNLSLANSDVFGEGTSWFGIRTIVLVDVPKSFTEYQQLIGRALRTCGHRKLDRRSRDVEIIIFAAELGASAGEVFTKITADEFFLNKLTSSFEPYNKLVETVQSGAINKPVVD